MTTESNSAKCAAKSAWTKPDLTKLGKIADVSGPKGSGVEGGPNSKS